MPLSISIALAIKIEDGGPIFYLQERWGKNGTRFKVYKFRTMVDNTDMGHEIIPAEESDPRITKVGKILRKCGMDELPQILNVLRGDMSFVGPRSLAIGEIIRDKNGRFTKYEEVPGFQDRLRVRPGLTGLATIYIPKDAAPRRKYRYDLLYIRKQTLMLDLHLILLSFWISFRGKWETRGRKL